MPKPSDVPRGKKKNPPPPEPIPEEPPPPEEPPTQEPPTGGNRIVVDPITRIEGHLRLETEINGGAVVNAWSTGTLFRGIETILQGRDPQDAWLFTQRLCGVCTYVHGSTSVRCVEDAIGLSVPEGARIVRNLLMGAQYLHDHVVHFYHLHALDWVDVVSALDGDPNAAARLAAGLANELQAGTPPTIDYAAVKAQLQAFVAGGQLGPFANAYWGHPAYRFNPDENLLLAAHYLEALKMQAKTARMHAIFGGKNPHVQSLRVGGVTCRREINAGRIGEFRALLQETRNFVDRIYLPDVVYLARKYGRPGPAGDDWSALGGSDHFLACGEFPQTGVEPRSLFFPQGVIIDRDLDNVQPLVTGEIAEHAFHSWYQNPSALHPAVGQTDPNYTGLDTTKRYSWLKAPRYQGRPMEVGPLARMLVAYGSGLAEAQGAVNAFLVDAQLPNIDAMFSVIGRTAARALETQIIGRAMVGWLDELAAIAGSATFQSAAIPTSGSGMGLNEAPRGALGHWINIQSGKIGNYQMVVPSTWNFGPRCDQNLPGPAESALVGTPVADMAKPLEILRTVHSLDPCIACAVHVIDPESDRTYEVRVV
jgi:[NiFe] hydrogenase large subunit